MKNAKPKLPRRGIKMIHGSGWKLIHKGRWYFLGTLKTTFNVSDKQRIAVFSVPKRK